ncbi:MAG: DHA2 family efflux MFS transporter permease subunit [Aphanothece sp. CMT-3BRIN-NPC111]|jgi:DHA2 family multidrug resistance protein|nr:DHA2 family efflux MFS transporter permease subunit [Aphanothece sp. CMT-3BRIN-NPC111]
MKQSPPSEPLREQPPAKSPEVNKWLITATIMISSLIVVIDTSIVNVAIPEIQKSLGASVHEISSVATFYIISTVIIMPLTGYLSALWGRKQFYAGAIILFTLSSLLCGLAWNLPSLVLFRILQGLAGGALLPSAQAILFETFPPEEQGKAMGIFGLGVIVGPAIGPVLGGYLTDSVGWRSIFTVNVPIGIIATLMVLKFIRNPSYIKKPQGKFDLPGLISLVVSLSSLQYALERGQSLGWLSSREIMGLVVIGLSSLAYFIRRELVTPHPIVDFSAFKNRAFVAGNIIGTITGFGLFGILFVLPLFMSNILHFNTVQMGLALMPGALSTALTMPLAGRLADRLEPWIPMSFGIAIVTLGTWQLSYLTAQSGYWDLFWPQVLRGIGLGLVFVPLSKATLGTISKAKTAAASGLYNLVRQLGGSTGIALLTVMLQYFQAVHLNNLNYAVAQHDPATLNQLHELATVFMQRKAIEGGNVPTQALSNMKELILSQAALEAYKDLFRYSAGIFMLNYLAVSFLKVKHPVSR